MGPFTLQQLIDGMSTHMLDALHFYAKTNPQGSIARRNLGNGGGTHGALHRRGLVGEGVDARGQSGYFLTPKAWACLRHLNGTVRPADANRLDLDAALAEAYPAEQHTAAGLPSGTRVMSSEGRLGTVNGLDIGRVTDTDHPNCGREYVGVTWDAVEGDMGCNRRSRPFVDELTIIARPESPRVGERVTYKIGRHTVNATVILLMNEAGQVGVVADGDQTGSVHYVHVAPGVLTVQAPDIDSLHAAALYENQLRTDFIAQHLPTQADTDGAPWGRSEDGRPMLPMGKHWTDIPELVNQQTADIRARVNQALPGRWYLDQRPEAPDDRVCTQRDGYTRTVGHITTDRPADLDLILHARADLDWCLYMIAKLRDARPAKGVELHAESRPMLPEAPPADAPRLTVEDVARRLAEIAHHEGDDQVAHGLEDQLHADVLRAIAAGAPDAEALAAAALRSKALDFARWYA